MNKNENSFSIKKAEVQKIVDSFSPKLTPRERDIVRLRLGMMDGRPRSFEEICMLFGTSKDVIQNQFDSVMERYPEETKRIYEILYT